MLLLILVINIGINLVINTSLQGSQGPVASRMMNNVPLPQHSAQGDGDRAAGVPAHSPAWALSRAKQPACLGHQAPSVTASTIALTSLSTARAE